MNGCESFERRKRALRWCELGDGRSRKSKEFGFEREFGMAEPGDIASLLREAQGRIRYLVDGQWPGMEELVFHILGVLIKIQTVLEIEGSAREKQAPIRTLSKQLAKDTDELVTRVKRRPKYSTIEFKCLDDYEKCRKHRSKYDLFCILSYLVCILRRIIPLVPHD